MIDQLPRFKEVIRSRVLRENARPSDRQTKKLLLYLFTSTRGGFTRLRIIVSLLDQPYNTHQLSKELGLDYKAVQHHMRVLEKNNMVSRIGEKYGVMFHLSEFLEANMGALEEAIDKLDRKMRRTKVYIQ